MKNSFQTESAVIRSWIPRSAPTLIGVALLTLSAFCASAATPKRVLILNPYGRDVEPFSSAVSSFRSTLSAELGEPVDFYEIPLDLARFTQTDGEEPLVAFLEELIEAVPMDLVVPVGGSGSQFADRHRSRLFPTAPVLLLTGDPRLIPSGFQESNTTIITQTADLHGMVEDMLLLRPKTRRIAVVFGASPLEDFWVNECRREFQPFENRIEFIWLNELPLDEIIETCRSLPPDSFILHGLYLEDLAGISSEKNEAIRRLHESANAPLFGYFESEFGLGIIGGQLYQNSKIGELGAHTAVRILRGEKPENIPVQILEPSQPRYDWRELRRWNIDEKNLPEGSLVEFREPGFWAQYGGWAIGAILFGTFQAFLIVGLIVNRTKWRKGEAEAVLIADISSKFVNLPFDEVDGEILDAHRRLCEFLDLDLIMLWQWDPRNSGHFKATHVYSSQSGSPSLTGVCEDDFPWIQKQALDSHVAAISSMDDLPEEAATDRETARLLGIKSTLWFSLGVGGGPVVGILSLTTIRAKRKWTGPMVNRIELIAQIFANALARKRFVETLSESLTRLSLATDFAGAGLWELDLDTQAFWISKEAREIFGYSLKEEINIERFKESIHPDDLERVQDGIRHAAESGDLLDLEYRIRLGDRGERWIALRGRSEFNPSGETQRLLGLSMDVTERKSADDALRQLSLVVEQSPALVLITDLAGRITYVNRKFTEVTGYAREECIGRNPRFLKSGETSPLFYKEMWIRLSGGEIWQGEFHNRKKNGDLYWERAVISPLLDATGKATHYVGIKEDITEAKSWATALRESEELNRITFEQNVIGIAHVSFEGRWLSVNDKLCGVVGYARDELLKLSYPEIVHPEDLPMHLSHLEPLLRGEMESRSREERYLRKDGSAVWVNRSSSLVRTSSGEPGHLVSLIEDITEQRRMEIEARELRSKLAHAARVTLLGQLASALAHELSQPLGAILRNAETAEIMLREPLPDLDELNAIVADILKDDHRAGEVIDRLRSLLKHRTLNPQALELGPVIDEVLSLIRADAATRQVRIEFIDQPGLPLVRGDRIHLQQVLLNLFVNAMDALDECPPGQRSIRVEVCDASPKFVQIRVLDNGPGIPSESLEQLFEPFFTSKTNGLGVGLAMSKTIIEAQHGIIWAENRPEGGACFCFTVPVADLTKD